MRWLALSLVRVLPAIDGLVLALLFALRFRSGFASENIGSLILLLLAVPVTHYFLRRFGAYDSHRVERPLEIVRRMLLSHICSAVIIGTAAELISPADLRSMMIVFGASSVLLSTTKAAVYIVLRSLRRHGLDQRNVLIVGKWAEAEALARRFSDHPEWGLRIDCVLLRGHVESAARTDRFVLFPDGSAAGPTIEDVLRSRVIDEIVIAVGEDSNSNVFEEARQFAPYGLQVRVVFGAGHLRPRVETYAGTASLDVVPARLDPRSMLLKRGVDIVLASLLLVLLAPVIAAVAMAVRLSSPGPLFFRQVRVGLNGRQFRMLKFRTMVDGAEFHVRHLHRSIARGPVFKDPTDYRVTSIGRFLRRFSLDELPQLVNVLFGDMSLVGPRPLPLAEANQVTGEYRRRFSVPPGLTCIWQVSGRSEIEYDRWMEYDLQYVDGWSMWADTKLLLRTIPAVLSGRGAY